MGGPEEQIDWSQGVCVPAPTLNWSSLFQASSPVTMFLSADDSAAPEDGVQSFTLEPGETVYARLQVSLAEAPEVDPVEQVQIWDQDQWNPGQVFFLSDESQQNWSQCNVDGQNLVFDTSVALGHLRSWTPDDDAQVTLLLANPGMTPTVARGWSMGWFLDYFALWPFNHHPPSPIY